MKKRRDEERFRELSQEVMREWDEQLEEIFGGKDHDQ